MKRRDRREVTRRGLDERGAILILALIFVVAVGLVATALATWATNDLNNSKVFTGVEALRTDATGMMKISEQYVRYNPLISTSQSANSPSPVTACWGGTVVADLPSIDSHQVAVWCSTVWNPGSANTRTVTFYACSYQVPASICTSPGGALLTQVVTYDDYQYQSGVTNAPIEALCTITCGSGMTVNSSTWGSTIINTNAITPATATFTQEPSPTTVGSPTTADVQITDASGLPISFDPVTLSALSGGTLSTQSTLTESTNASGIAVFNNIIPATAGNIILSASDGTVSTTSTAFNSGRGSNNIAISSAPTNPQVGTTVNVTATATSQDPLSSSGAAGTISVTGTANICRATGGTVQLIGVGQCTLTFSDSGNANYLPATNSIQFTVSAPGPAQIAMSAGSNSVSASGVTNETLTLTLLSASGAPTVSTGTTTVDLSQDGSGYFATTNGVAPNTTTATFLNGSGSTTVYFGDTAAESVHVTASSGTLTSATTTVNVVAGPLNKVQVNVGATTTASSTANDAMTLVLQDQYGNAVSPTGATQLNLSTSGSGYFASSTGTPITAVSVPAGSSSVSVSFGDTVAETSNLGVTGPGGASGSASVTVSPAAASQVILSTTTTATASTTANDALTISLKDAFNNSVTPTSNTVVSLASSGSGYFAANSGSSSTITSATINANNPSVTVYFGDATAETANLTASSAAVSSGTTSIIVSPAANTGILMQPQTPTMTATGRGADPITLTLVDQNGNPVSASGNVTLQLTDSSTNGFFTKYQGGTGHITSTKIAAGTSSVVVYFRDTLAESFTLQANGFSAGSPVSGSASLQVVAGPYSQIGMSPNPFNVLNSTTTNTQIDLQAEDQYGNATSIGAPSTTFYITDNSAGCYSGALGVNDFVNGDYCNNNNNDSSNYNYVWSFNLTGGQATVFFGDNLPGDQPTISIYPTNPYVNNSSPIAQLQAYVQ